METNKTDFELTGANPQHYFEAKGCKIPQIDKLFFGTYISEKLGQIRFFSNLSPLRGGGGVVSIEFTNYVHLIKFTMKIFNII